MRINGKLILSVIVFTGVISLILGLSSAASLNVSQGLRVYVMPVSFLDNPQTNVYDHRMIYINFSQNFNSDIKYADIGEEFYRICKNCDEYGFSKTKRLPFDDGFHQVVFFSQFETYSLYKYVNFTVDTHKPIIRRTYPTTKFADGNFSVQFYEQNPIAIGLFYGNIVKGYRYQAINFSNCYNIYMSRTECSVDVNLTDYDTGEIFYKFNITDILNQYGESKPKKVNVDFTPPEIIVFNYSRDSRNKNRINFYFELDEPNFRVINYIDNSQRNPVSKPLCTSLTKSNTCKKTKIFSSGSHDLTIEIIDKAGNVNRINKVIV